MITDLGHTMVSCKDEARLFITVEVGEKLLCLFDDEVDNLDIVHIFLRRSELRSEDGRNHSLWTVAYMSDRWYPDQVDAGKTQPCRRAIVNQVQDLMMRFGITSEVGPIPKYLKR